MNNLHRELAPISDAAWSQIEEETSRTFKRYLAGRRVVDVHGPGGVALSAVGTGHLRNVAPPADGILARQREVNALVELRVPFDLDRQQIDDVERGADDSDWQPAKDAARLLAFAEDRAIFEGYARRRHHRHPQGNQQSDDDASGRRPRLPGRHRPGAEPAASRRRQWSLLRPAERRCLYGIERDQRSRLSRPGAHQAPVDGEIIWAPAITGAFVLTTRGGDFGLHIGEDVSIGYLSHDDRTVRLYLRRHSPSSC